ncbi:MAG: LPS assembly protein LptD [Burkholderiales bacterium]|nr:LPS assembly protein LptD [Burkholderiales bacterium]
MVSKKFRCSTLFASVMVACLSFQPHSVQAQYLAPEATSPIRLNQTRQLDTKAPTERDYTNTYLNAYRLDVYPDEKYILTDEAEVRKGGAVLKGDVITYTLANDTVNSIGNAFLARSGSEFEAPELVYRLDAGTGKITNAKFRYVPISLRGTANEIDIEGEGQAKLCNAFVTTCAEGDESWYIKASTLDLDFDDEVGYGKNTVLYFANIPVFGTPWFTFPLSDKRQSGFLAPKVGFNSDKGFNAEIPFYWNIAPNYDYTVDLNPMTKRGILFGNDFRYLEPWFAGEVQYDIMWHDHETGRNRYAFSWQHTQRLPGGIRLGLDYTKFSDNDYREDFSNDIRDSGDNVFRQNIWLSYGQRYWSTSLGIYKNQTLRPNGYYVEQPYMKVPEYRLRGFVADFHGLSASSEVVATHFRAGDNIWGTSTIPRGKSRSGDGNRLLWNTEFSYPLEGSWWFITPKFQYVAAWYGDVTGTKYNSGSVDIYKNSHRTLPIYTLDAGITLSREFQLLGRDMEQTLEPRLYYAYIPYRDQTHLPNFESSTFDVSFASLFYANQFTSYDRISQANQLTAALSTKFLDSETGEEWFLFGIGQRYYFDNQKVGLYWAENTDYERRSDIIGSTEFTLLKGLRAEFSAQYSTSLSRFNKMTAGFRYNPKPSSVVSLYYRYNYNPNDTREAYYNTNIRQIDFSFQWPFTKDIYGLGRYAWSLRDHKIVDAVLGLEYREGCWILRTAFQRYAKSGDRYGTSFYFEIELVGLGGIGASPIEALRESITGYRPIGPEPQQVGRYDYYE